MAPMSASERPHADRDDPGAPRLQSGPAGHRPDAGRLAPYVLPAHGPGHPAHELRVESEPVHELAPGTADPGTRLPVVHTGKGRRDRPPPSGPAGRAHIPPTPPEEPGHVQAARIHLVGIDTPRLRQVRVESLPRPRREPGRVRKPEGDLRDGDRSVAKDAVDDRLILFGGVGACGVDDRAPGPGEADRVAEERFLHPRHIAGELGGPGWEPARPSAVVPLPGTGSVDEDAVERHPLREIPPVPGDHDHIPVPEPVDVAEKPPDPLLLRLDRDEGTRLPHEFREVRRLAARCRAEVEDPFPGRDAESERGQRHDRLLDVEKPDPVLNRLGDGSRSGREAEVGIQPRDRLRPESGAGEPVGEGGRRDTAAPYPEGDGLGRAVRCEKPFPLPDERPVSLKRHGCPRGRGTGGGRPGGPTGAAPCAVRRSRPRGPQTRSGQTCGGALGRAPPEDTLSPPAVPVDRVAVPWRTPGVSTNVRASAARLRVICGILRPGNTPNR